MMMMMTKMMLMLMMITLMMLNYTVTQYNEIPNYSYIFLDFFLY